MILPKEPKKGVRTLTTGVKSVTGSQKLLSSLVRGMTALYWIAGPAYAQEDENRIPFLAADADITCKRGDCPKLQHLNLGLRASYRDRASLQLAWDPGHVEKANWADTYDVLQQRLPPRKTWFDYFALRLRANERVEISIEDWKGATLLPDASGLSFAHALQDSGWNQTALRISGMSSDNPLNTWSLIAGLGEGERFKESDHKPYIGLMLRRELTQGLEWQLGWSFDPDSVETAQFYWLDPADRKSARAGYQTQRQALSLIVNSLHPKARGLRAALGVQRNLLRGPGTLFTPPKDDPFDPTEILGEKLERRALSLSASYLILSEYLIAFHAQQLQILLRGDETINACEGLDPNGLCIGAALPEKRLNMQEHTFGLGRIDEDGWSLFLESFSVRYDRLYELYHFAPEQNRRQRGLSFTQLRLRWAL